MRCPRCQLALIRADRPPLRLWVCEACEGTAATLAVLHRRFAHDVVQAIWNRAVGHGRLALLRCPSCRTSMLRVPSDGPALALCRGCQLAWLDPGAEAVLEDAAGRPSGRPLLPPPRPRLLPAR